MDQGGGSKKDCHIPKAQSQKLSAQVWVSFPSWRQEEDAVAVFCVLFMRCPKYVLWSWWKSQSKAGLCGKNIFNGLGPHVDFLAREMWRCYFCFCLLSSLNLKCVLHCLSSSWNFPECRDWLYQVTILVRWVKSKCVFTSNWNGQTKQSGQFWRAFQLTVLILFFGPFSSKALRHVLKVKACA